MESPDLAAWHVSNQLARPEHHSDIMTSFAQAPDARQSYDDSHLVAIKTSQAKCQLFHCKDLKDSNASTQNHTLSIKEAWDK
jgi:hypothetical protein